MTHRLFDDRGQANIIVVPVVVALLVVTLLLIRNLGSGVDESRQARTAADAAALAAVDTWSDAIKTQFDLARTSGSEDDFWQLVGRPLSWFTTRDALCASADSFARKNGSTLVSCVPGADGTVTVRVRDNRSLPDTGQQAEHSSTAQLQFVSGVCRSGSQIGYLIGRTCQTQAPAPAPPAAPIDPGAPAPAPVPSPAFTAPDGLGTFDIQAVIVA